MIYDIVNENKDGFINDIEAEHFLTRFWNNYPIKEKKEEEKIGILNKLIYNKNKTV